jgi:predicted RNA methylase
VSKPLGNRRVTGTEQFYTPLPLAKELVRFSAGVIPDFSGRKFLEPAGGSGSFISALTEAGVKSISSVDLYPKFKGVQRKNFLEYKPREVNLVTISNPPFGRNNALSIPFFNHASDFSEYIAFLVPRSWRKWSVENRLDLRFHKIADQDVFVSYVDLHGNPFKKNNGLRTCFQIWKKEPLERAKTLVPDNLLIEKTTPRKADVAMRVFGYGCGQILKDFPRTKNTTLMFLKVRNQQVLKALGQLEYQRFSINTAYTEALALSEINFLLNEKFFGSGFHRQQVEN